MTLSMYKTNILTDDDFTSVIYHSTAIVKFNEYVIELDTGGWHTVTTKRKMNQASDMFRLGFKVYQKDFEWYVDYRGETFPFDNYLILHRDQKG